MSLARDADPEEQGSAEAPGRSRLSQFVHDLSGPAVTANGFAGELELARQSVTELLKKLPADTDPELMKELVFQVEDEMKHCLFRIEESLEKLDKTIDSIKAS